MQSIPHGDSTSFRSLVQLRWHHRRHVVVVVIVVSSSSSS
jgi:hypothetical protein